VRNKNYFFEPQYEPHSEETKKRVRLFLQNKEHFDPARHKNQNGSRHNPYQILQRISENGLHPLGRNKRCVWTIPTQAFPGAHFATYPERLCETPIQAGCPEFICVKCGEAKKKIYEPTPDYAALLKENKVSGANLEDWFPRRISRLQPGRKSGSKRRATAEYLVKGHTDCGCGAPFRPGIVLDPFFGAGTTALAALKLHRQVIGIEINPAYVEIAKTRVSPFL